MKIFFRILSVLVGFPLVACSLNSALVATQTPSISPTPTSILLCNSTDWCYISTPTGIEPLPTAAISLITSDKDVYLLVEDRRYETLIDTETVPIDNCTGPAGITITPSLRKAYTAGVEIGTSSGMDIGEFVKVSIAAYYNINISETIEYSTSSEFVAPPGIIVQYKILWLEDIIEGRIIPLKSLEAGELVEIPYRAKSKIHVNIPSPITFPCPQTPTYTPTETLIPIPTSTITFTPLPIIIEESTETPTVTPIP